MDEKDQEQKVKSKESWREKWRWGLVAFVVISACIAVYFFFLRFNGFSEFWGKLFTAGSSIVIGLVIAYLVNPIVNFFERLLNKWFKKFMKERTAKKTAKGIAIALTMLLFIAAVALLIWAVVPSLVASIASLVKTLPGEVEDLIENWEEWKYGDSAFIKSIEDYLTDSTEWFKNYAQKTLMPQAQTYITTISSGIYSVIRGIINFIIGILVAIYVLMIKDTLKGQSKKVVYAIFKPKAANIVLSTARKSHEIFGGFVSGKIIDSAIIGVLCYIGCLILRIPQPVLIAVLIGVTNIIPVFGPFIGAIPSLFLVVIESPIHALYLLIFIIILQQVDGNVIGPKILGNSTGLSTFWVMFAILVGSGLFGFMGMLLGVPVFGVIYYIVKQIVEYIVRKRKLPADTKTYINADYVDVETNTVVQGDPEEAHRRRKKEAQQKAAEKETLAKKMIDKQINTVKNKKANREKASKENRTPRVRRQKKNKEN